MNHLPHIFFSYKSQEDHPNIADYDKRTPLHLAAAENQLKIVKYLIEEWKVDPHAKDRYVGILFCTDEYSLFDK